MFGMVKEKKECRSWYEIRDEIVGQIKANKYVQFDRDEISADAVLLIVEGYRMEQHYKEKFPEQAHLFCASEMGESEEMMVLRMGW